MSIARSRSVLGAGVALGAALVLAAVVPGAHAAGRDLSADIGVAQQPSATEAGVKSRIGFVVTVANHGPESAPSVKATDTIGGQLNLVSVAPSQGSCLKAQRTFTCFFG